MSKLPDVLRCDLRNVLAPGLSAALLMLTLGTVRAADVPFSEQTPIGGMVAARNITVADVDGDGDGDVLTASWSGDQFGPGVFWWENRGTNSEWTKRTIDADFAAVSIHAADVDGDGRVDVLSTSQVENTLGRNEVVWWRNEGGDPPGWSKRVIRRNLNSARSVFVADVDGDDDNDVLAAIGPGERGAIAWYENEGGISTERVIDNSLRTSDSVFGADLDGDGDVDAVSADFADNRVAWHENDGAQPPSWTRHILDDNFRSAQKVVAVDVDNDDDTDILAVAFNTEIAWWENSGDQPPSWTKRSITMDFFARRNVVPSDIDGDDDMDILAWGSPNDLNWWENDGESPPGWSKRTIDEEISSLGIAAGDIDADGDIDMVGQDRRPYETPDGFCRDCTLVWWENQTFSPALINGVLDGASSLSAVTPGGTFQAFLRPGTVPETRFATTIPLPSEVGLSITVDGTPAPLFGVFRGEDFGAGFDQANGMVPWGTPPGNTASFAVGSPGAASAPKSQLGPAFDVQVNAASPGIYTLQFGAGPAIVQNHSDGSFAHAAGSFPGLNTRPAPIGGVITIWANGLGPIDGIVADGDVPGLDNPLLEPTKAVKLFIGGVEARILGSPVLHPTLVALFQINAIVPDSVTPGDEVPIEIEVDCGDGNVFRSRDDVVIAVGSAESSVP